MTKEQYIKIRSNPQQVLNIYFKLIEPDKSISEVNNVIEYINIHKMVDILDLHFECTYVYNKEKTQIVKVF